MIYCSIRDFSFRKDMLSMNELAVSKQFFGFLVRYIMNNKQSSDGFRKKPVQMAIKRVFDIVASFVLILLFFAIPVFIVVPILICATSKGPAVFTQERVGRNGKIFKIFKFRTMLIPEERIMADGTALEPNDSITGVGNWLRKTSIDELPQLFNILIGDMSFCGPRPMLPYQVDKIEESQKIRHVMRPGITGLAQVMGRNNLEWDQKLKYDVDYIQQFSLLFDIKIFLKTVKVVLKHEGIEYVHTLSKD